MMWEQIILGMIQGIAEWLPVSSEGLLVLAKTHLWPGQENIEALIQQALSLHLGTFLAALVYLRKDVVRLIKALGRFRSQSQETQNLIIFLLVSTLISGILGLMLIKLLSHVMDTFHNTGKLITLLIGLLLLGTGFLQLRAKKDGLKEIKDLNIVDGVVLGFVQGLAALPGLSRSGLTVSAFLLRKFDKIQALKLSFLMSLPIVLGGNIILNFHDFIWSSSIITGIAASFFFGLATIHLLLKLAQKINFGYFVLIFGLATIVFTLV